MPKARSSATFAPHWRRNNRLWTNITGARVLKRRSSNTVGYRTTGEWLVSSSSVSEIAAAAGAPAANQSVWSGLAEELGFPPNPTRSGPPGKCADSRSLVAIAGKL